MTAIESLIKSHVEHLAEEIDTAARYALLDLRERCMFHKRGLGQRARALFGSDQKDVNE